MADLPSNRRYSDEEVARLLERATQLQADARPIVPGSGLTLRELESIAGEVGLDPAALRQPRRSWTRARAGGRDWLRRSRERP